jgi:hypothetical protein
MAGSKAAPIHGAKAWRAASEAVAQQRSILAGRVAAMLSALAEVIPGPQA